MGALVEGLGLNENLLVSGRRPPFWTSRGFTYLLRTSRERAVHAHPFEEELRVSLLHESDAPMHFGRRSNYESANLGTQMLHGLIGPDYSVELFAHTRAWGGGQIKGPLRSAQDVHDGRWNAVSAGRAEPVVDRHVFDPADDARLKPLHGSSHLHVLEPLKQVTEDDLKLQPGDVGAQAEVLTDSECDMAIR